VSALLEQVKQLWKAGKYGEMDELIAAEAEKEPEAVAAPVAASLPALSYLFDAGHNYRMHFKNGCSGEYVGEVLANRFPFDLEQVESVERIA
jgi:hypothetical protein